MEDRRVISEGLAAATLLDAEVRFVNEANRVIEEELSSALAYVAASASKWFEVRFCWVLFPWMCCSMA